MATKFQAVQIKMARPILIEGEILLSEFGLMKAFFEIFQFLSKNLDFPLAGGANFVKKTLAKWTC